VDLPKNYLNEIFSEDFSSIFLRSRGTGAVMLTSGHSVRLQWDRGDGTLWANTAVGYPAATCRKCKGVPPRHVTQRQFSHSGCVPLHREWTRPTNSIHERYNRFRLQPQINSSRHDVTCPSRACLMLRYTMTSQSHYTAQSHTMRCGGKRRLSGVSSALLFRIGFERYLNNNIYCNWVVTRWQWLFYIYTKHETGFY